MKKRFKKIYIEITNQCNLQCSFCSKSTRKKQSLKADEFLHILDKVKAWTDYIYLHVKGEPLLHPDIIFFLEEAEKRNLKVNLTTNGTLFKNYAKKLGNCKALKKINFSLHSENNNENYLEDIFNNIKYLSKDTTVIYRLWTLNNGKFDKKSTEIVNKIILHYNLSTNIVEKLYHENNINITSTIYVDKDNEFIWPSEEVNGPTNGYCKALKTQIAILVDGTVVPCCLDSEGLINLGNIYNEDLEDILEKEKTKKIIKSFQDRKPQEKVCQKCTYKLKFK